MARQEVSHAWRIEQLVGSGSDTVLVTLRSLATNSDTNVEPLENDPTVRERISVGSDVHQVTVAAEAVPYDGWVSRSGVLDRAAVTDVGWILELRFPDRMAVQEYYHECHGDGLQPTIRRIERCTAEEWGAGCDLTGKQAEALSAAYRLGFYNVPRAADLEEVAATVGSSKQAVSETLRRGLDTVLERRFDPSEPLTEPVSDRGDSRPDPTQPRP